MGHSRWTNVPSLEDHCSYFTYPGIITSSQGAGTRRRQNDIKNTPSRKRLGRAGFSLAGADVYPALNLLKPGFRQKLRLAGIFKFH